MEPLRAVEVAKMIGGKLLRGDGSTEIKGVCTDSRQLVPGECFVALPGENYDGHEYIANALAAGAAAIVLRDLREIPDLSNHPIIQVPCTYTALENLARSYAARFSIFSIAITGSLGKTTSKELTAQLLSEHCQVLKSQKSFNNSIGVPLTLLQLEKSHQVAVLELGANHLGEISPLTRLVRPDLAVITCIASSHLEGFGDLSGIEKAKAEILEGLQEDGTFLTNADDPACRRIAASFRGRVRTFGTCADADYRATDIVATEREIKFHIAGEQMSAPIFGAHHLTNILVAISVAREMGFPLAAIQRGLASLSLPPMRMQIEKLAGITVINDAYNASPHAVVSAVRSLSEYPSLRKVAILGSMLELGQESARLHRETGQSIAECGIEQVCVVGEEAYPIAEGAIAKGMTRSQVKRFADKQSLLEQLPFLLKTGDVVLLKASRGSRFEEIYRELAKIYGGNTAEHSCRQTAM